MLSEEKQNYQKRAFVFVMVALGVAFFYLMRPMLIPILLGMILVVLLHPTYQVILKFCKGYRYVASSIATLLIFLLLVLPTGIVIALLANQAIDFFSQGNVQETIGRLFTDEAYQRFVQPLMLQLQEHFKFQIDLPRLLMNAARETLRHLTAFSPQVLSLTTSFVFSFFVMHFSIFFLFVEGDKVFKIFLDLSPIKARYEQRLGSDFKNMIYATVYGYLVTALVQAALAGIGFYVAGVPAPLVFGTLTFFMAMVPIVGATAVWLPLTLWLYLQGEKGAAIGLGIYGFVLISGVDNFLKPLIIQGRAKVHPLMIFFSLFGGIKLFGPIGILFGPVITALFFACIRIYREDFVTTNDSTS